MTTTTPSHFPLTAPTSSSDEDAFHDARESFSPSTLSNPNLPTYLPTSYSCIEPLPSSAPPTESELSILKIAKEILSNVKPGSDVTNINLPASILDPESTLEKGKKSMQRGELLQDICASSDPESRFLNVIRFNLSGLARERFGKKPYNPVLGEVYRCCFPHRGAAGETVLIAEQVSHHPPITALHLRNDTLGIRMNSYTAPEPRFWVNMLEVKLAGEIRLLLTKFDEEYVITRPDIHMSGFFAGRQRLEFNGKSTFVCAKSGLAANLEYKAKGALNIRGDMHGISGSVFDQQSGDVIYTIDGHWDKKLTLTHRATKQQRVLFDYEAVINDKSMIAITPPDEQLEDSFSTKVWAKCSRAIRNGNSVSANDEKRKVEEHQRHLKKQRHAGRLEWQYRYFEKCEDGGYDLRSDFNTDSLSKLSLSSTQIDQLRSGEMVKNMLLERATDSDGADNKGKLGRRRLLVRGRGSKA